MNQNERINDELLVIRVQEGAVEALTELVGRWQDRLWRLAWRLTGDEQAAWDVLQEAWIAISRRIGRLGDPSAFPAWAYRITSNKSRDWIRRRRRMRRADEAYGQHWHEMDGGQNHAERQYADLREALADLAGGDRAILSLRYEDGFSTAEIGEILGIPAGTVKSRLHYARQRLRRFFEEEGDE
ncbi:MAG: RNA polymerase sigma factor [Pirellulales bacterium]|jgi:RNA polymerase sigma-70 factor (ECF subfamily)|nr:RNA polymerase sigma factor [Thermoguttaceae bacterium]MDD4786867.1 RNA polymerase sigma factor [Pirellulales bacterium]MDI9444204.1 RNA polymerase sigma factor [Planctomycetota bacterium]NLZ01395.1 RNA polymerase sigma factor [Pirellulaceae bacterium]